MLIWQDNTDAAIAETEAERARLAASGGGRPILGIHVVVGPSFWDKARNGNRNMLEDRIRLINAVLAAIEASRASASRVLDAGS